MDMVDLKQWIPFRSSRTHARSTELPESERAKQQSIQVAVESGRRSS